MQARLPPPNRVFGAVDAVGIVCATGFLAVRVLPLASLSFWSCPIRRSMGFPCPACGLTRAAEHLIHGQIGPAFWANPLGAVVGLFLLGICALTVLHLGFRVPIPEIRIRRNERIALAWIGLALALVNYDYLILGAR